MTEVDSKKLKIAMVVDSYDSHGGGLVSTKRFTEALRKRGNKVTVISTGKCDKDKVVLKSFYVPFAKRIMKDMDVAFAVPDEQKIKDVLKNVDVVHIQLPFYLGIKTITYARELGKPVVVSFHVQAENITKNIGVSSKRVINLIYRFFVKNFYNRSDLVICPSKFAQTELKSFGLKAKNKILSNGHIPEYYPQRVKRKFSNKFVILCVGRLSAEKNQKMIIEAISKSKYSKEIQLLIKGHGPMKKELKEFSKILPNKPVFFEQLPLKKMVELFNSADMLVHAGMVELEGMVVLEAISCGVPPLIYDYPKSASSQFALTNKSLFKSVEDLTKKIDFWYEHPHELQLAKEQYLELSKKYTIEESTKKLEKYYLEAIEQNKKKPKKETEKKNGRSWFRFLKVFAKLKNIKNIRIPRPFKRKKK